MSDDLRKACEDVLRKLLALLVGLMVGCDEGGQIQCVTPDGTVLLYRGHYDKETEWGYAVYGDTIYSKAVCVKVPPLKEDK